MFVCIFPPRGLYLTKKGQKIVSEVQTSLISVPSGNTPGKWGEKECEGLIPINKTLLKPSSHSFKDSSEKMLFMIIWRWQIYALSPTTLRKKCHEKTPYIIDGLVCIYKRSLSHPFVQIYDKVLAVCLPIKNPIFYFTIICSIRINPWGKSQT